MRPYLLELTADLLTDLAPKIATAKVTQKEIFKAINMLIEVKEDMFPSSSEPRLLTTEESIAYVAAVERFFSENADDQV